jgi:hypothetical protein
MEAHSQAFWRDEDLKWIAGISLKKRFHTAKAVFLSMQEYENV